MYRAGRSNLAPSRAKTWLAGFLLSVLLVAPQAHGLTLKELREDVALTPERLLHYFSDFKFKLGEQVQPIETFLSSKAGDCDDFATLAASLLREKGYTPRLIAVFMEHQVHVVCYILETKSYLDFNNRKKASPAVSSDGTLADIAQKVALTFHAPWNCASEFIYRNGVRQTLWTDFRQLSDDSSGNRGARVKPRPAAGSSFAAPAAFHP